VDHPKWRKAAEIIRECDRIVGHKPYIRVLMTDDPAVEKHQPITLDISQI
jgi:hypothetical protein